MNPSDFQPFSDRICRLADIYGKILKTPAIDAYFEALNRYGLVEVVQALNQIAENEERFPAPAKIKGYVQAARGARSTVEETPPLTPEEKRRATVFMIEFAERWPSFAAALWGDGTSPSLPVWEGMQTTLGTRRDPSETTEEEKAELDQAFRRLSATNFYKQGPQLRPGDDFLPNPMD